MKIETNPRSSLVVGSSNARPDAAVATRYQPDALVVPVSPVLERTPNLDAGAKPPSTRSSTSASGSEAQDGGKATLEEPIGVRLIGGQSASPGATTQQSEEQDVEVAPESLLGTRIRAVKQLLGDEANDLDDTALLGLANDIHQKAHAVLVVDGQRKTIDEALDGASRDDVEAIKLSQALFAEEASIWLEWNGVNPSQVPPTKAVQAYREVWDLAANPPSMPTFKSREELAKAHIETKRLPRETWHPVGHTSELQPEVTAPSRLETEEEHISRIANTQEIKQSYFNQFTEYRNSDAFKRLLSFKALADTQSLGLGWCDLETVTKNIHVIDRIGCFDGVTSRHARWGQQLHVKTYSDNPAILAYTPSGKYLFIDADGSSRLIDPASINKGGKLSSSKILRAIIETDPKLSAKERAEWLRAIEKDLGEISIQTKSNSINLRGLIEASNKNVLEDAFDKWKETNYNATGLYGVVRNMVPFFKTIEDSRNDKNFVLNFSDIALDVFDLAVTLGTIALSAGVGGAVVAGKNALVAGGKIGSVLRAAKAAVAHMKTAFQLKAFLKTAGKEAVDFIVPVFSAADLAKAGIRLSIKGVTAAGSGLSDAARLLRGRLASSGADLTHDVVSAARKVKLSNGPSLTRFALPSRPDNVRLHDKGLWISESGWDQYVKVDDDFYRVVRDHATDTKSRPIWKIQTPDGSASGALKAAPIRVEFKDGNWKIVTDRPGLFGSDRHFESIDVTSVKQDFDANGLTESSVPAIRKCVDDIKSANQVKRLELDQEVDDLAQSLDLLASECKERDNLKRAGKTDDARTAEATIKNSSAPGLMEKLVNVTKNINAKLEAIEIIKQGVKAIVDKAFDSDESDGQILHLMSEAEAKDIMKSGQIRRGLTTGKGKSSEQHKWFYTNPKDVPAPTKSTPYRLEINAPESVIKQILKKASDKRDDALAAFRHKLGVVNGPSGPEGAQPGAFGVQAYGLEEFSRLLGKFKWKIVSTEDPKMVLAQSKH